MWVRPIPAIFGRMKFHLKRHLWSAGMHQAAERNDMPNIVLVHGAWADGSSWSGVIESLQADGYSVMAPQFPMSQLADDVARLRQVLALQDRQTIVVGHSYGGQ